MEVAGEEKYPQIIALVTAWKNFLIVAMKHLPFESTAEQKYFLANDARKALIEELEQMGSMRAIVLLAELCLMLSTKWGRYDSTCSCEARTILVIVFLQAYFCSNFALSARSECVIGK
jgi:hypothetical protein